MLQKTLYTQLAEQNARAMEYEWLGSGWWCFLASLLSLLTQTCTDNCKRSCYRVEAQPSAAVIRVANADSWVNLFSNLAAITMKNISGVKMHINLSFVWVSGLVCMCIWCVGTESNEKNFCPAAFNVYVWDKDRQNRVRAASRLRRRLSGLRLC